MAALAKQYPPIRAEILERYEAIGPGRARSILESILLEFADEQIALDLMADGAHRVLGFGIEKSGVVAVH